MEDIPEIVQGSFVDKNINLLAKMDWKKEGLEIIINSLNIIPVFGGALSAYAKQGLSVRDAQFVRKFVAMVYELKDIDEEKRLSFIDEVEKKAQDYAGNVLVDIIDRIDNINKAEIIANLIKAKISGEISIDDFFRLSVVTERIPYTDINALSKYDKPLKDQGAETSMLSACGVLNMLRTGGGKENIYSLSKLGRQLLRHGMNMDISLEAPNKTEVAVPWVDVEDRPQPMTKQDLSEIVECLK